MKKRWIALLCALSLFTLPACAEEPDGSQTMEPTGAADAAQGTGYPDVAGDEWFAQAVEEMTGAGIMTGLEGGIFGPYEPVTRATVITVLWRLEGSPMASVEEPFPDAEGDWFAVQAAWAKGTGVATGYADGTFGGRDLVTREQLASFLYRYAIHKGEPLATGALGLFKDQEAVSPWAQDAVRHAVGLGILQGNDKGTLEPQGLADRAALAVMLQRMRTPAVG